MCSAPNLSERMQGTSPKRELLDRLFETALKPPDDCISCATTRNIYGISMDHLVTNTYHQDRLQIVTKRLQSQAKKYQAQAKLLVDKQLSPP